MVPWPYGPLNSEDCTDGRSFRDVEIDSLVKRASTGSGELTGGANAYSTGFDSTNLARHWPKTLEASLTDETDE